MLAIAHSATLVGVDALPVRIEVEASRGVPVFELVGLAEASVRESRVRVKSALSQLGVELSDTHITVSLAPADLRKTGSGFDLGIAAAAMAAAGAAPPEALSDMLFLGELSLAGKVHAIRGVLPHLVSAKARGVRRAVVPRANEAEARLVTGIDCRTCDTLEELALFLRGEGELPRPTVAPSTAAPASEPMIMEDLADVRGQDGAKRALEIAAAGGHNVLFIGPPGAGKTMLARRLPGILPELSHEEALEVMALHSVAGLLSRSHAFSTQRPFRAPHHTISDVALVGGGDTPRPGEVSLAHRGVLFLDELGEYKRSALESLRQPLEDGVVTVSRAHAKATFRARAMVVAATNPCPCGHLGRSNVPCRCSRERILSYRARLSGPLLDRLDLQIVLAPVEVSSLHADEAGEASRDVRARVVAARALQRERAGRAEEHLNAALPPRELHRACKLSAECRDLLTRAAAALGLSARAYTKVLRVARTIADLEAEPTIAPAHIAEAISYRALDKERTEARPAA